VYYYIARLPVSNSLTYLGTNTSTILLHRVLEYLIYLLLIPDGFEIRIRSRRVRGHLVTQRPGQGFLLGLLDAADLVFALSGGFGFGGLFVFIVVIVVSGVPVQISSLLPAADGGHEGMAEVVLAVAGGLHIGPFEVAATAS
jgi:hypothetical protein